MDKDRFDPNRSLADVYDMANLARPSAEAIAQSKLRHPGAQFWPEQLAATVMPVTVEPLPEGVISLADYRSQR